MEALAGAVGMGVGDSPGEGERAEAEGSPEGTARPMDRLSIREEAAPARRHQEGLAHWVVRRTDRLVGLSGDRETTKVVPTARDRSWGVVLCPGDVESVDHAQVELAQSGGGALSSPKH